MAGYAAVISLKNTIEHLRQSSLLSPVPPSLQLLQLAYIELEIFQEILERSDNIHVNKSRKKVNDLDGRIKEAVWEFEDLLESHLSHQIILSQVEAEDALFVSIDLQCYQHHVDSFIEKLKYMQKEYIDELHNMPRVEADELVSSVFDSVGTKSEMVGLSSKYENMRRHLMEGDAYTVALVGLPGIGKTRFAKKLFEDPEVSRCFELRVWLTVGRNYEMDEISQAILAKLDPDAEEGESLKEKMKGKSCFIVLDDVWDEMVLDYLETSLPDKNDDGKVVILVTSRIPGIIGYERGTEWMRLLNVDESKELLRQRVFGEEGFPPNLKEAAEKIAKNCEGLPLMILRVAHRLSKANNFEPQYWDEVAKRRSSVFMDAYNEISEVLFPTYDCLLPQRAKLLFISVAAFPHDYEIHVSKLNNLLIAERFPQLTYMISQTLEDFGHQILFILKWTAKNDWVIKTFRVYSWWWHLFNREAYKDKINRVLYSGGGGEVEDGVKGHRRLCLHTNFLFNFKNVYDTVKSDCASNARSLFCFGPYHQYSMPLDVGFKLLRVLDALKVRFYSFPLEILELVLLQYLALSCNGKLPTFISKLFNLQFLIIHPHMAIKSYGQTSYLPVQIWDMHELRHIEILGNDLPKPNSAVSLKRLSKLLGVSPESCTREVLKMIPDLRKLGVQIELTPHKEKSIPPSFFNHISELQNLESLKCSIVNPEMTLTPTPMSMLPSKLRKLCLSGLGYPWEYTKVIGLLPDLQVLKLRCYAFRGPMWEAESGSFMRLNYLLIEDTDLVQWKPYGSFPELRTLCIKHCYKLKELHWPLSDSIERIELVNCNPLAVACAMKLKGIRKYGGIEVVASFDNKELN